MIGGFIGLGIGIPLVLEEAVVPPLPFIPQKQTIVRRRWLDKIRFDFVIKVE